MCFFVGLTHTHTLPIRKVGKVIPLESLEISLLQPFFLNPSTLLKMNFKITSNRGSTLGDSMFQSFALNNLLFQEIPPTGPTGYGGPLKPWVSSSPSNATYWGVRVSWDSAPWTSVPEVKSILLRRVELLLESGIPPKKNTDVYDPWKRIPYHTILFYLHAWVDIFMVNVGKHTSSIGYYGHGSTVMNQWFFMASTQLISFLPWFSQIFVA